MSSDKCQPDDPRRCQGTTSNGQCVYTSVEGSKFCEFHCGNARGGNQEKQKKVNRYLIDNQELRTSYNRQLDDRDYLSMKEDIMLTQAMIERRLASINTDADLTMAVGQFSQLLQRLESMKVNLLKMQSTLGLVLGKDQLRILARDMAEILDEELEGIEDKDERMDRISLRLFEAVEDAGTRDEDE